MALEVGAVVVALQSVTEPGFKGKRQFTHAKKGDEGRVVGVCGDWRTVAWPGGTATDCHVTEIRAQVLDGHAK